MTPRNRKVFLYFFARMVDSISMTSNASKRLQQQAEILISEIRALPVVQHRVARFDIAEIIANQKAVRAGLIAFGEAETRRLAFKDGQ